jgi:hypothetical protein
MELRGVLRRAAIVGAALALTWTVGGAARAAVLHGTFSGVMTSGFDFHNTFGAGSDLTGLAITGHLYLDTAAAPAGVPAGSLTNIYENFTGAPWLWGSFTINGVTRNVGPDFRTYTAVSSADFGATGDFLTFETNADVIETQPGLETLLRSSLSLSLFDIDDIIVPGKDLPSTAFSWIPDNPSDSGSGSIQAFDQREFLPNGPLENFTTVLGDFSLTAVTFEVVNAPPSLPLFATGLATLALIGVAHVRQRAVPPGSNPKALA